MGLHRANEMMADTPRNVSMGLSKKKPTSWLWFHENSNHTRSLMKCAKEQKKKRLSYDTSFDGVVPEGTGTLMLHALHVPLPRRRCVQELFVTVITVVLPKRHVSLSLSLALKLLDESPARNARKVLDERRSDGVVGRFEN